MSLKINLSFGRFAIGLCAAILLTAMIRQNCLAADIEQLNFSLPSTSGEVIQLRPSADYRLEVIAFLGCECPLAKIYAGRLNQLASEFSDQDVRFIGVNSNPQDSMAELKSFAQQHDLQFPLVKDHDSTALIALRATRTPEVIVVDSLGSVIYRGRIDDQYRPGVIQPNPTRSDLREAIGEYLAGHKVSVPQTEPAGCLIAKSRVVDPACDVTYCGQVAVLLRRHCVECHREGEIGPFPLTDYESAAGWSDMILETIDQRRMPPWHATSTHDALMNERHMLDVDRQLIRRWVEGGVPYGDPSQLPPEPALTTDGWQMTRVPDRIFEVSKSPFKVAADGVIEYQYFVVDPKFENDVWVNAAEIQPGNRAVLHHAIAFIRPPDGQPLSGLGLLAAYVPGQRLAPTKTGFAKQIPAGSKIVFQMHYTPTGSEQSDASRLGLSIVDRKSVTHEMITLAGINHELEIPPHEANVAVESGSTQFPKDGELLSIAPHMHLRGKSVTVQVKQADHSRTILEVPHYDFNWQHTYLFRDPIKLADVESLSFTATFDNSNANPFNPDPSQFVTWGDQTWEEMAIVFYEIAKPLESVGVAAARAKPEVRKSSLLDQHEKIADELMSDLDHDGNGVIEQDELELAVKWRLFGQLDENRDRKVDRDEVLQYVRTHR